MYSAKNEDSSQPPPDAGKFIKLGIIAIIGIIIFALAGNQAVVLSMNVTEFADVFTKPLMFSLIGGISLASIALLRVNAVKRSSIFWFFINTAINMMNRGPQDQVQQTVPNFSEYKLSGGHFALWQITKILLLGAFFANLMFGFGLLYMIEGNDLGVENITTLFSLPFVTPPNDPTFAMDNVTPMIPALLIVIPPIIGAIGLRLILFVGIHYIIKVVTLYLHDTKEGKPRYLNYMATIEAVIGIGIIWAAFNMFFTDTIDYNTRYAIGGTFVVGFALIAFSIFDRMRARVLTHMFKRDVYIRVAAIIAIALIVGIAMGVNNSVADAKKIEYLGPYTAQQIGVNRYLAELDMINENTHEVQITSVNPNVIESYIDQNEDVLSKIRVWDWNAAFAKLKPEIGLIPYVDFEDNDILRFDDKLYWTASMKPILPSSVSLENQWYNEHLVYTHVPDGFLTLEATEGTIVDSSELFEQRAIYYGEGGLLDDTWSGYPVNRVDSAELNGAKYDGAGGVDVPPPLSWIFEPNFILSYPGESLHIMRYKDVNERMQTLYPYFLYNMFGKELDSYPVTDGKNTYWLVPLIVGFDTRDQLDDSIPAVENFLILADRYEASPAPIYVQYIPLSELFSSESWTMIGDIEEAVRSTEGSSEVTSLRSTLESSANTDSILDGILQSITDNPTNQSNWDSLSSWVLNNETGREITARYVPDEGGQTVIQFSAATVDWSDTVDFEERLTTALDGIDGEGEMGVAGRPLILAQVTEGVASAAVLSTLVVASVILFMLIGLQSVEKRDKKRAFVTGLFMWIPLGMVVVWVYGLMGILGYQLNAQTVTIGALTLGLGVDYAVHYAHRYEEERLASPTSTPEVWVARTTVTTGRAMAGAAITTAGGFAVLNLSGLAPLRLFGQVFLVAILLALISSLVLLPVLFSLRPGESEVNLVPESE